MTQYYVKNGGNDALDGLSDTNAWETLERVRSDFQNEFVDGDVISFNGGDVFDVENSNYWLTKFTPAGQIVTMNSYGTGQAIINTPTDLTSTAAIRFEGAGGGAATVRGGVTVDNLSFFAEVRNFYGVYLTQAMVEINIVNCTFNGFAMGVRFAHYNLQFPKDCTVVGNSFNNLDGAGAVDGTCSNLLVEGNTFNNCGFGDGTKNHSIYLSGGDGDGTYNNPAISITVRDNIFYNDSHNFTPNPEGGSTAITIVMHGVMEDILIEGNHLIESVGTPSATGWGIGVDGGYGSEERFTNVTIRNNIIETCGNIGIDVDAAVGIHVYNNMIQFTGDYYDSGIVTGVMIQRADGAVNIQKSTDVEVYNNVFYVDETKAASPTAANLTNPEIVNIIKEENNELVEYTPPLACKFMQLPTKGYLSGIGVDGSFTYTDQEAPAVDSFTYKRQDAVGESNVATVDITVNASSQELTFNGASYIKIDEIVLQIGDIVKYEYAATVNTGIMFWTDVDTTANRFNVTWESSWRMLGCSLVVDSVPTSLYDPVTAAHTDGNWHSVEATITIAGGLLTNFGANWNETTFLPSGCKLRNLEVIRGTTLVKYNIDSGNIDTEAASVGIGDATFHGVDAGDWS